MKINPGAVGVFMALVAATGCLRHGATDASSKREKYSLAEAQGVPIAAKEAKLPLYVFGDEAGKHVPFIPSGYMGDGTSLKVTTTMKSAPTSSGQTGRTSLKIQYKPKGRQGWAGVYWLTPANNWGRIKGAGYNLTGAQRLNFWMRGEGGGERIVEIKLGGLIGPYPDTDAASVGPIKLSDTWQKYSIDLTGKDLRHIVGGFAFMVRRADNPRGATFYLDEIVYEGGSVTEIPPVVVSTPTSLTPPPPAVTNLPLQPVRTVISFDNGVATFHASDKSELGPIIQLAKTHPSTRIIVEGHTDSIGPQDLNRRLSDERAHVVADYLEQQGIEQRRMKIEGFGPNRPVEPNTTEEGRRRNRRVEVVLVPETKP